MTNHRVKIGRKQRMHTWCRFGPKYWFLKYKWKENLSGDLIAGVTMAIIQIPQGKLYFLFHILLQFNLYNMIIIKFR